MSDSRNMQPGEVIADRYRLDSVLGEGGFGVVWRGWHIPLQRTVAIKLLRNNDPELRHRFREEARALGRLTHPNCIGVFDTGVTAGGEPFIVMEFVAGRPLSALMGRQPIPIAEVVTIAQQLADALTYAHDQGVIHRDLKPDNILLEEVDGATVVKVVDFGIAKVTAPEQQDVTKTGEVIGTPQYMSPEQLRGRGVGPLSDLYAVGLIIHELIEGTRPFRGDDPLSTAMAHLLEEPADIERPDCPPYLKAVVARLLRKKASERYPDARTLRRHLDPDRAQSPIVEVVGSPARAVVVIAVTATLVTLVGLGLAFRNEPLPPQPAAPSVRAVTAVLAQAPSAEPEETADVGVALPEQVGARTPGCGKPIGTRGFSRNSHLVGIQSFPYSRVVPTSYDPSVPMAVALVLPGGDEDKVEFLRSSGLPTMAEERGILLVSSDFLEGLTFDDSLVPEAREFLDRVGGELCFDPKRVFVIGHSQGAIAAERLACQPWVAGAALSSYGRGIDLPTRCKTPHPVPTIAFWPLKSGVHPVAGGNHPVCRSTNQLPLASLDEMIATWRGRQGCVGKDVEQKRYVDGVCTIETCEVPFQSCRLDGGHGWPGTPPRRADLASMGMQLVFDECDGVPARFPTAEVIGEFFAPLL